MPTFRISVEMHVDAEDGRVAMQTFERELEEHGALAGDIVIEVLPDDDDDDDEEEAQQLGMGLGASAYNDAMGCEVTSEDPNNMPT